MDEKQRNLIEKTVDNPNQVRRKLVHSAWAIPIVMSVNLPAHAQTSCCTPPPGDTPPALIPSCSIALSQNAVTLVGAGQQTISPFIDITITNTGDVPLTHPSASDLTAGLSLIPTISGPFSSAISTNGGIPNPLMPGQSHTVTLTAIGISSCIDGAINVQFSRNGTQCSVPLSVFCIVPVP